MKRWERIVAQRVYRFERLAYYMVVVGVLGDQLSTRLALTHPLMYEFNPFSVWCMGRGVWLSIDLVLLLAMIVVPAFLMREWSFDGKWAVLVCPFLFGLVRSLAAVHNLLGYFLLFL